MNKTIDEIRKELEENSFAETLSHYTSLFGISNILSKQKFQLSVSKNLNDPNDEMDRFWSFCEAFDESIDSEESLYHWYAYCELKGVQIVINAEKFVEFFIQNKNKLTMSKIVYLTKKEKEILKDFYEKSNTPLEQQKMYMIKDIAWKGDREIRAIFEGVDEVEFPWNAVEKITISPLYSGLEVVKLGIESVIKNAKISQRIKVEYSKIKIRRDKYEK